MSAAWIMSLGGNYEACGGLSAVVNSYTLVLIFKENQRRVRLVIGWVTDCRQIKHLGM